MSEDTNSLTKVVGRNSSSESLYTQDPSSTSGEHIVSIDRKGLIVTGIDSGSFEYASVDENFNLNIPQNSRNTTTSGSEPDKKGTMHLYKTTRHMSKVIQQKPRPPTPVELATLALEAMLIEDNARPKAHNSQSSNNLDTFCGSDSGSNTSIHTVPLSPIHPSITERKNTSAGVLSVGMDLRLRRARAEVNSLREPERLQASRGKTLSHSSLRAERAEIAQSQVSTGSLDPATPIIDHFQEYMTYFDLDNATNPPAKGFMESDDSSSEEDNLSVGTIVPTKPIKPQGERMARRCRPVKKHIFCVPDNFEALLAQAPTTPPTRSLPLIPTDDQAPATFLKGPIPLLPTVALTQPAEAQESTSKMEALAKEYSDYLSNTNRDESTRVKCKNKTESKPGLEADLEAFMESESVAADWMRRERKI
ncbi:hypothetical protein DFP73DRAFT_592752 [Morchella snyderi]|nr:hypothetical protein DFP73DRAFT_592752 [Morchella snyderi]